MHPVMPSKPFWKTGSGIALIVVGGLVAIIAVCIFGCLGMAVVGSHVPTPTAT